MKFSLEHLGYGKNECEYKRHPREHGKKGFTALQFTFRSFVHNFCAFLFIKTNNSQLHLHTFLFIDFFLCALEWITNNQLNESGESVTMGKMWKSNLQIACVGESKIFHSIHASFFVSFLHRQNIWKFLATQKKKSDKDFLSLYILKLSFYWRRTVRRLKVLELAFSGWVEWCFRENAFWSARRISGQKFNPARYIIICTAQW